MNQTVKIKNLRCQHCLFHLKNLQSYYSFKSDLVRSKFLSGAKGHSFILCRNYSTNIPEPLNLEFLLPLPLDAFTVTEIQVTHSASKQSIPSRLFNESHTFSCSKHTQAKCIKIKKQNKKITNRVPSHRGQCFTTGILKTQTRGRRAGKMLIWTFFSRSWLCVWHSRKNPRGEHWSRLVRINRWHLHPSFRQELISSRQCEKKIFISKQQLVVSRFTQGRGETKAELLYHTLYSKKALIWNPFHSHPFWALHWFSR